MANIRNRVKKYFEIIKNTIRYSSSEVKYISSVHQLQDINDDVSANYVLTQDIDATETENWNDGRGFKPIGDSDGLFNSREEPSFKGTFDGQGYEIKGLYIDRPDEDNVGLFGKSIGSIKNVGLVNNKVVGNKNVGGLVGSNSGDVSESYSTGNVEGELDVGGIVGNNKSGNVTKSYSTGNVSSNEPVGPVGGLVGSNNGNISNSYSKGDVAGYNLSGSLVGVNMGDISQSYSVGNISIYKYIAQDGELIPLSDKVENVSDYSNTGGFIGCNHSDGSLKGSYFNKETIEQLPADCGTGLETSEMQGRNAEPNMNSFDFESVWKTVPGDYPELR